MQFLRGSPYQAHDGTGRVEIAAFNGYEGKVFVFHFTDAHQMLDFAEKLRLVGNTMLRDAPRPKP
jgi:hypothetical protein